MNKEKNITLLCKVVDNYGDIGFVYRLSRSISLLAPEKKLTLVVSNLESFSAMAPEVDPSKKVQECFGWTVLDWNADNECTEYFTKNTPDVILECFQCGRPDWLENLLFAKDNSKLYQIVNVEYLTAEEWADDFHLLKSATRSALVKKVNFMPGFTEKTGGLVLDREFISYLEDEENAYKALKNHLPEEDLEALRDQNTFCVTLFSYPREYGHILRTLYAFEDSKRNENPNFKIKILCANGACYKNLSATDNPGSIKISQLPYLPQSQWDALLTLCDFNFIRGEDSFSRACLSGIPFVWHAYIQDEEFQLVKLQAILDRIKPYLKENDYRNLLHYSVLYNHEKKVLFGEEALDVFTKAFGESKSKAQSLVSEKEALLEFEEERLLMELLLNAKELKKGFENFAEKLISNGDLAEKLLSYVDNL